MPIYVSMDSSDIWGSPELFRLNAEMKPTHVAGCPPDDFSPTGQLWGNPLYNWEEHKKDDYKWWTERIKFATSMYDIVRIDHFRGFESYYSIPFGDETAENGEWKKGPAAELFAEIEKKLGKLNLIAEDLGFITPEVREMLDTVGYPGMKVLQFGFDGDSTNEYLPHNYKTSNMVVYTGTHDNPTLKGWISTLSKKTLKHCFEYMQIERKRQLSGALIRLGWASCADIAVAQIQDFLKADETGRMNTPSTLGNNWKYRIKAEELSPELIKEIKNLNRLFNR
jgi:4-alpha-glucanotransferase